MSNRHWSVLAPACVLFAVLAPFAIRQQPLLFGIVATAVWLSAAAVSSRRFADWLVSQFHADDRWGWTWREMQAAAWCVVAPAGAWTGGLWLFAAAASGHLGGFAWIGLVVGAGMLVMHLLRRCRLHRGWHAGGSDACVEAAHAAARTGRR